ncbi:MAG TPA: DUF58 domain-containing protein [Chloroflexota bacterium]|nr:DUF58 domain-containing protein [Chloroflexota bacterium]
MLRTLGFVALWLFIFLTALSGGWSVMFRLSYLLLLLFIASWLWTWASARWIALERRPLQQRAQVGSPLEEALTLRNLSWLPKPWMDIQAASTLPGHRAQLFASLGPRGEQTWTLSTICHQRGRYQLGPTTVAVGDPFGLFHRQRVFPAESAVIVYPQTVPLRGFRAPDGALPGGGTHRVRVPHTTAMATSIRDYQPGDPFNRIHWPNTARLGRLLVKEFEQDPVADVWVVLDLDRNVHVGSGHDSTEEYAVTAAASLASHFLLENRAVGLVTQGHHLLPDRGTRQLMKILELLAVVRVREFQGAGELLAANGPLLARGTSALVVTPTTRAEWLAALEDLVQRGVRSAVVLLEASTFGGSRPSLMLVGSLAAAGFPTYLVKHGESLDQALAEQRPAVGAEAGV